MIDIKRLRGLRRKSTPGPSDQEIENVAMASGILKSQEHWGVRYYTNKGSDLFRFARALLARYGSRHA